MFRCQSRTRRVPRLPASTHTVINGSLCVRQYSLRLFTSSLTAADSMFGRGFETKTLHPFSHDQAPQQSGAFADPLTFANGAIKALQICLLLTKSKFEMMQQQ